MARTGSWCWIICIVALLSLKAPSIPMVSSARLAEADPQVNVAGESTLEKESLSRFYDPVEIRAEILADLLGTRLSELRLYIYSSGSFHQVPFQFDEWTNEGSMILDRGGEANAGLGNGVLDRNDMLVFMARDAGDRVSNYLWPNGAGQGVELELLDPLTNGKGWVYLLHFSQSVPEVDFKPLAVVDDTEKYIGQGASYTILGTNHVIGKKVYKTIINQHIGVKKRAGGDEKNFIDRSKFRVAARLMFGAIHVGFNEDDFIGDVSKYKLGNVRSVARQWLSITMPLGLKPPKIYGDVYVYDTMILIVFETNMPFNPKYLLTDYRMTVGYDLYPEKGYGMMWFNSNNPDGFIVDGWTSPQEAQVNDTHDQWRCIVGPNGWMVHRSMWDKLYHSRAEIKSITGMIFSTRTHRTIILEI